MKLNTNLILKPFRSPFSGRAKLARSTTMMSAVGSTNDTNALKGLRYRVTCTNVVVFFIYIYIYFTLLHH